MIGRRSTGELAASARIARLGAFMVVASLLGLMAGSLWTFLPLLDGRELSTWGIVAAVALLLAIGGLGLLSLLRRRRACEVG